MADRSLRRSGPGGRLVLGGSPVRLYRLSPAGADVLDSALDRVVDGGLGRGGHRTPATARLLCRLVDAGAIHPVPSPGCAGAPEAAEVTVVVPVHDDADALAGLLASLERSDPRPARVIVVDDASADATAIRRVVDAAGRRGLELDLFRRAACDGPGAARNTGVASVRTPLVAFVDADCEVGPDWLPGLLAQLSDPAVALVAPRVRALAEPGALARYERVRSPLDLGDEPARIAPGTRVAYVPSAAMLLRRAVFDDLGGFDPALRLGEDVDLVWRLVAAGHRARYEPASTVQHRVRPTWRAWARQRIDYGSSAAALAGRHGDAVAPVVLSPWSAAVWALVAVGHPVAGVALAGATTARLRQRLPDLSASDVARLGLLGHLGAGEQLGRAVVRVWWPLALVAAVASRHARRVAVSSVVATAALAAWRVGSLHDDRTTEAVRSWLGRARVGALAVVDDLAYGAGVWLGCRRERSVQALLPSLRGAGTGRPDGGS